MCEWYMVPEGPDMGQRWAALAWVTRAASFPIYYSPYHYHQPRASLPDQTLGVLPSQLNVFIGPVAL